MEILSRKIVHVCNSVVYTCEIEHFSDSCGSQGATNITIDNMYICRAGRLYRLWD